MEESQTTLDLSTPHKDDSPKPVKSYRKPDATRRGNSTLRNGFLFSLFFSAIILIPGWFSLFMCVEDRTAKLSMMKPIYNSACIGGLAIGGRPFFVYAVFGLVVVWTHFFMYLLIAVILRPMNWLNNKISLDVFKNEGMFKTLEIHRIQMVVSLAIITPASPSLSIRVS
jgi:hypothetical protein